MQKHGRHMGERETVLRYLKETGYPKLVRSHPACAEADWVVVYPNAYAFNFMPSVILAAFRGDRPTWEEDDCPGWVYDGKTCVFLGQDFDYDFGWQRDEAFLEAVNSDKGGKWLFSASELKAPGKRTGIQEV